MKYFSYLINWQQVVNSSKIVVDFYPTADTLPVNLNKQSRITGPADGLCHPSTASVM